MFRFSCSGKNSGNPDGVKVEQNGKEGRQVEISIYDILMKPIARLHVEMCYACSKNNFLSSIFRFPIHVQETKVDHNGKMN